MSRHAVKAALLCAAIAIPAAAQEPRVHLPAPGETDEWCITPIVWDGQDDDGPLAAIMEQKAYLGVELGELTDAKAKELGGSGTKGALVERVLPGSPAETAGLKDGDVVLSVDGKAVASSEELRAALADKKPGDAVTLVVSRAGKRQTISATLAGRFGSAKVYGMPGGRSGGFGAMPFPGFGGPGGFEHGEPFLMAFPGAPRLGVSVLPMTDDLRDYFGVEHGKGVLVSAVTRNGAAANAGIRAGDVILTVDGETVTRAGDVSRVLAGKMTDGGKSAEGPRPVQIELVRERSRQTVSATVEAPRVTNEE